LISSCGGRRESIKEGRPRLEGTAEEVRSGPEESGEDSYADKKSEQERTQVSL